MFAVIHGMSPEGLPNQLYLSSGGPYDAPSPALAAVLQRIAWQTVCQYPRDGVSCAAVGSHEPPVRSYRISPNPAGDYLTIEHDTGAPLRLRLSDSMGRMLRSFEVNGERTQLSLEGLPGGWYFLKMENAHAPESKAFWKQN